MANLSVFSLSVLYCKMEILAQSDKLTYSGHTFVYLLFLANCWNPLTSYAYFPISNEEEFILISWYYYGKIMGFVEIPAVWVPLMNGSICLLGLGLLIKLYLSKYSKLS